MAPPRPSRRATPLNAALITGATTFTDTSAVNGTTYYYVVVAVDLADQASAASTAVSGDAGPGECRA